MYCRLYDPEGKNSGNPLAWPACATEDDVRGLMPHFILVQELDPLRDEGVAYYRTLARAGVQAQCMMEMGVTHSAYGLSTHMPDFFRRSIALLSGFAHSL
jgi:acetyl esterase/lipase